MSVNHLRSKWAAVGAAVAVSLGAGGIGITQATTSSGEKPVYLPIEPCRLADTRPEFQVGPRSAPLGPDETYTLSGQGSVGNCNLPVGTAALSLNVTALDATAPTFLSLFPAGASVPVASHLNPLPGDGPVPNAVNVDLSAAGEFSIYNLAGNVNIIIDVVGIFDDHVHDDRYYTEAEVDTAVGAKADATAVNAALGADIVTGHGTNGLTVNAGAGGTLTLDYFQSGTVVNGAGNAQVSFSAPVTMHGVGYELANIEYCVRGFAGGATVNKVAVNVLGNLLSLPFDTASDDTDRTTSGCYSFDVGAVGGHGFDFSISKTGGGSFTLTGLQATWTATS
jgi:hypothetical protein